MREYLYNLATDKSRGFVSAIIKVFLYLLSLVYGLLVMILALFYRFRPVKLNCKVISVGNITLGGTGKTSLVEFIARYLRQQGHKVAILSRGYRRRGTRDEGRGMDYETMGDEAYMLARNLGDIPVIVDADRIRAAKTAVRDYGVDTVILDDGFQQWKIKKDLEIVTIGAGNPFGNKQLIPRGILRQPLSSLAGADIFVLTKTDLSPNLKYIKDFLLRLTPRHKGVGGCTLSAVNKKALILDSVHRPLGFYVLDKDKELIPVERFKGKAAALFSGIGDPGSFEAMIKRMGINVVLSRVFPDHHAYSQEELEGIMQESRKKGIETVITTEKDAVRINRGQETGDRRQIFYLRIELKIVKDEQRFYNRLLSIYPA